MAEIEDYAHVSSWIQSLASRATEVHRLTLEGLAALRDARLNENDSYSSFRGAAVLGFMPIVTPSFSYEQLEIEDKKAWEGVLHELDRAIEAQEPAWLRRIGVWNADFPGTAGHFVLTAAARRGDPPVTPELPVEGVSHPGSPRRNEGNEAEAWASAPLLDVNPQGHWTVRAGAPQTTQATTLKWPYGNEGPIQVWAKAKNSLTTTPKLRLQSKLLLALTMRAVGVDVDLPKAHKSTLSKISTALKGAGLPVKDPGSPRMVLEGTLLLGPVALNEARSAFSAATVQRFLEAVEDRRPKSA